MESDDHRIKMYGSNRWYNFHCYSLCIYPVGFLNDALLLIEIVFNVTGNDEQIESGKRIQISALFIPSTFVLGEGTNPFIVLYLCYILKNKVDDNL